VEGTRFLVEKLDIEDGKDLTKYVTRQMRDVNYNDSLSVNASIREIKDMVEEQRSFLTENEDDNSDFWEYLNGLDTDRKEDDRISSQKAAEWLSIIFDNPTKDMSTHKLRYRYNLVSRLVIVRSIERTMIHMLICCNTIAIP